MTNTSIFSIQPPEWLQKRAMFDYESNVESAGKAGQTVGATLGAGIEKTFGSPTDKRNFFQMISDAYQTANDPLWMEKASAAKAQSELVQAQKKDQLQGMKEYPEWMQQTGGDWKKVLDISTLL